MTVALILLAVAWLSLWLVWSRMATPMCAWLAREAASARSGFFYWWFWGCEKIIYTVGVFTFMYMSYSTTLVLSSPL